MGQSFNVNVNTVQTHSSLPLVQARVKSEILLGIIDTGSSITCLSAKYLHLVKNVNRIDTLDIRVFNGNCFTSEGTADINLDFGSFNMNLKNVSILKDLSYDFILGIPHIKSLQLEFTNGIQNIKLNGHDLNVEFASNACFARSNVMVPAQSVVYAPIMSKLGLPPGPIFAQARTCIPKHMRGLTIIDTMSTSDNPLVQLVNTTDKDIPIHANFALASLRKYSDPAVNALHVIKNEAAENKRHLEFMNRRSKKFKPIKVPEIEFDPDIATLDKNLIQQVLNENYTCFAYHKYDVGLIKGMRYRVDLKPDAKNWFQPQRRIAPAKCQEVREQLQKEFDNGLITKASSKFNHALVLVRKPDGGLRICSDLREMNKNIEVERFPLPNIDTLFDRLADELRSSTDRIFIASFDIQSAYRALEICDKDKNKLAFSFESDMYQHERMAFGLADAPATFSYVMRIILNGLKGVFNYLDDVLIIRRGLDNFITSLKELFKKLSEYGLLLKPSKCKIGLKEVPFLGHILTPTGIKIQPKKVEAIKNLKPPGSKDELRSILGMFNYHHNAVKNLYTILAPLFDLLKQSRKFKWSRACQNAFNNAKQAIADATEKRHRDISLPLVLSADASNVGCGAVLYQKRGDELEPLQYFSKNFTECEQKLPIRSRELLSITLAIKNFETTLVGENFTVLTDHKSLVYLNNTAIDALCIRTRNMLWYLSHFDFKICHISGTDDRNKISDCLSRAVAFKGIDISEADIFETGDDFRDINNINVIEPILSSEIETVFASIFDPQTFLQNQRADKTISDKLKSGKARERGNVIIDDSGRVFIPDVHVDSIIQFIHTKKSHLATDKLASYMSKYFAIPKLTEKCAQNVKNCLDCLASKEWPKLISDKQEDQHVITGPFVKVFCDLIDLGSHSKSGMRYGLTYMDSMTRHLDCVPLADKRQETVAKGLIQLIMRWGVPESIVTDNGAEFVNMTNELLIKIFGIYVSRISPYNPRGNMVERAHKEMKKMFLLYKVELETWDDWLPLILFSYNTAIHGALPNLSPFEALFLRPSKDLLSIGRSEKLNNKWLKRFPELKPFDELVKHSIYKFKSRKKDLKIPTKLNAGDKVLVYSNVKLGKSKKLHRHWSGPYTVLKKTSPGVYELCNDATKQRILRNIRLLRICDSKTANATPLTSNSGPPPSEDIHTESESTASDDEAPPPVPPKQTRAGRQITLPSRYRD